MDVEPEVTIREGQKKKEQMNLRKIQLAMVAASLAGAMCASASITMTLGDTSTYSGNPSGKWGITVAGYNGGQDFVAGRNVGIYELKDGPSLPGGPNAWGVCISPQGTVNYGSHTYDVLTFNDPSAVALNSPVWASGGLLKASQIMNTWESTVLAAHSTAKRAAGWALTAAIYSVLYQSANVTISDPTVQSYYNTFTASYSGNPVGYLLRPNPIIEGSAGQEFLIPVPEPTTWLAGALLLLPFGLSTLRMLRRKA